MIAIPRPVPDPLTEPFWQGCRAGELRIQRCDRCHRYVHLPRPVCPACGSTELTATPVSGRGTLYTFTIATQAFHPAFADRLPYVLAIVELDEQPALRMVSNLVDHDDDYAAGDTVEVVFHRIDDDLVLPLFRPLKDAA